MYYITSTNRFQKRYTSISENLPALRNNPNFNIQRITFLYAPPLSETAYQYTEFRIPKASGGFRTINAPSDQLKERQRILVSHLQNYCKILESPWAYAYVKETCAVDALKAHQRNNSKWFLKLDIKDFFPSCTPQVVHNSLRQLFPICAWDGADQRAFFDLINQYCFFNEHLPQGAASSPYLSNLTLLPYDYKIFKLLQTAETFQKQKYIFTRYADDILISAKNEFNWQEITSQIQNIFETNFILKAEKTRYGSSAGRNWNLGCMLNTDNNITIGYRQKESWKRRMMEIIIRHRNNEPIPLAEKQQLTGLLAYYKSIEPDYFTYLNRHYSDKYQANFEAIIKPTL